MTGHTSQTVRSQIAVEDILLAVLGLLSGPLLWWMGSTWRQIPAASSVQALEYWIALICGLIGMTLCVLWFLFFIAGLGLLIGLKTRNQLVTYWSELFTPKFLRRIIISLFGAQLALASPALATSIEQETPNIDHSVQPEPFMPYVHEESVSTTEETPEPPLSATTEQLSPTPAPPKRPSASVSASPSLPAEPRQHSEVVVTPQPTVETELSDELVPLPRQTSTLDVETESGSLSKGTLEAQDHQQTYLPQQPIPSPYIAAPNQSRTTEDPTVIVKTGDCLWDIAHQELGADATLFQIDQRWRQWWDYNHETIGDDPHTLHPGSQLKAPPFTH